jgi:putative membrane protein
LLAIHAQYEHTFSPSAPIPRSDIAPIVAGGHPVFWRGIRPGEARIILVQRYRYIRKCDTKRMLNLDLLLAIVHHLLIFAVFGFLLAEFITLRTPLSRDSIARIAAADLGYGIAAALIVLIGFARAIFAAKGWAYYSHNAFFWLKLGTFAVIGVLSIKPTILFIRWRRAADLPGAAEVQAMRGRLHFELALFAFLPIFAAAMARGFGEF